MERNVSDALGAALGPTLSERLVTGDAHLVKLWRFPGCQVVLSPHERTEGVDGSRARG